MMMKDMKKNKNTTDGNQIEVEGKIHTIRKKIIHYYDLSSEDDSKLSGEQAELWENEKPKDDHNKSRNKEENEKALVTKEMTLSNLGRNIFIGVSAATNVVQRLWDPGGPSYTSRSSFLGNQEKLGKPKYYLDYIHLLALSSHPSLVILMFILLPKLHLGKLDCMGSFRYLPRLEQ